MLLGRKALLEEELRKVHAEASAIYLKMVKRHGWSNGGLVPSRYRERYDELQDKASALSFELNCVNILLSENKP